MIPGKGFVPIDRVREMAARGFSEPEMIDVLRREGFSADEVDRALTQALRVGVTGEQHQHDMMQNPQQQWQPIYQRAERQAPQPQQQPFQWPASGNQLPPEPLPEQHQPQLQQSIGGLPTLQALEAQNPKEQPQTVPQIPETSLPEGYYSQQYSSEEYIDYVVQQRVGEVNDRIDEMNRRHKDLQRKMDEIMEAVKSQNKTEGIVQKDQIMVKIENFSETVADMDNRLSGLEKAFKDTLPALIDSVRALSDIVHKVKREQI
jgi:hypothetical protein